MFYLFIFCARRSHSIIKVINIILLFHQQRYGHRLAPVWAQNWTAAFAIASSGHLTIRGVSISKCFFNAQLTILFASVNMF